MPEIRACWVGATRYRAPLPAGLERKWSGLVSAEITPFVVGLHTGLRPLHFEQAGVRFYLLPNVPLALLRYALLFLVAPFVVLAVVLRHNVQVIVAQSPYEGVPAAWAKALARLFGRRVALVVESHGDFAESLFYYRKISFQALYRRFMRGAAQYAVRRAAALRAVSSSTRQQLAAMMPPNTPLEQFMAWVDLTTFEAQARTQPLTAASAIVFAGVLVPIKQVHVLIAAFAQIAPYHPAAHLWLIGSAADAAYYQQLVTAIEQNNLRDRIHLTGELPQSELAAHLRQARVLALVSAYEGMPRIMIEAMLTGLPIVGTRVGGIPDVVIPGQTGYLVPVGDAAAVAAALEAALTDPTIAVLGANAQALARRVFSPEAYFAGYRHLLETAVARV